MQDCTKEVKRRQRVYDSCGVVLGLMQKVSPGFKKKKIKLCINRPIDNFESYTGTSIYQLLFKCYF
jgi:hypothetical protein